MPQKIRVLLVEDNEDERSFMKEGFIQSGLYEVVGDVEDGNDMLRYFDSRPSPMPELVVSDLNMPGRNGYEVIVDIKTNSELSHLSVVILTTAPLLPYAVVVKAWVPVPITPSPRLSSNTMFLRQPFMMISCTGA